ncbi:MAG: type IV toxin-antitoxin system AbiEi family antitoxin domain-containing protein [Solirubrobacteraceae bacterium]
MGDKGRIEHQIARIAQQQQGNITRGQLLALGVHPDTIKRWVRLGRLYRVYRGVYSVGRPPTTPLEKAAAAVLACGDRAALGFGSALTLHGFWKRWDEPFEVVLAGDRRPPAIRTHRMAGLLRRDIDREQGIRVTSPALTLLHCAPRIRPRSVTRAVNDWRRAELVTLGELADVVNRFPLHPGAPLLRPHAGATQNPTRSDLEDDLIPFCERFGLPEPRINVPLYGYEVDAYFEEAKLIVECDGWDFHNDRQAFETDRERDAVMLEHGIATVRLTRRRFKQQPEREAARLHAILDRRRRPAA